MKFARISSAGSKQIAPLIVDSKKNRSHSSLEADRANTLDQAQGGQGAGSPPCDTHGFMELAVCFRRSGLLPVKIDTTGAGILLPAKERTKRLTALFL